MVIHPTSKSLASFKYVLDPTFTFLVVQVIITSCDHSVFLPVVLQITVKTIPSYTQHT